MYGSLWPQTVRWVAIDVYLTEPLRGFKQDLITPATTAEPPLHLCCSYTITSHKESISPCSHLEGRGGGDDWRCGYKGIKKEQSVTCVCHKADCFPPLWCRFIQQNRDWTSGQLIQTFNSVIANTWCLVALSWGRPLPHREWFVLFNRQRENSREKTTEYRAVWMTGELRSADIMRQSALPTINGDKQKK